MSYFCTDVHFFEPAERPYPPRYCRATLVLVHLTPAEELAISHIFDGSLADLAPSVPNELVDEGLMTSWGEANEIRAQFIHEVLDGQFIGGDKRHPRALRIRGARIVGRIDLEGLRSTIRLELTACQILGGVNAVDCSIPRLLFDRSLISTNATNALSAVNIAGAHIGGRLSMLHATIRNDVGPALTGDGALIDGDAILAGSFEAHSTGGYSAVRLGNANIKGSLVMSGATLRSQSGSALAADGLTVGGSATFDRGFNATARTPQGTLRLSGAHIGRQLTLAGGVIENQNGPALQANGVVVSGGLFASSVRAVGAGDEGVINLHGSHIFGQLDLFRALVVSTTGPAVVADGMKVEGDAILTSQLITKDDESQRGTLRVPGAHITGRLTMSNSNLANGSGPALIGDGMTVDGDAFLDGTFSATGSFERGTIRMLNSKIRGLLVMSGATLQNDIGPAFHADGIVVGGSAYLDDGFEATGQGEQGSVRLVDARIEKQLIMSGATLLNTLGPALVADTIFVGGRLSLDEKFTATGQGGEGAVRVPGARIGAQLVLSQARLTCNGGPALMAESAVIDGDALFDATFDADANKTQQVAVLSNMQIRGALQVDPRILELVGSGYRWGIDGLSYNSHPSVGFNTWLEFLRKGTSFYHPQPYRQLAAAATAAGHEGDARRALIAQRDDQVARGNLGFGARSWARFTKYTLGYGYKPWLALSWLGLVLGIAVATVFLTPDALAYADRGQATACRPVEAFEIAFDIVVPLISTSTGTACEISRSLGGQFIAWASIPFAIAGWALTALFAAGFTSIIRRP